MSSRAFRITFSIDEADAKYFRALFQKAKKAAAEEDPQEVLKGARALVERVRKSERAPGFVLEAVQTLEDLTRIIEDEDWAAPKKVTSRVLGALAYFSNPEDLIPDQIPVLGFLDDAIMIKIVEEEFKEELAGYRRFRRFRDGAEQRPWTGIAQERLPKRLRDERAKLRAQIDSKAAGRASRWFRLF